MEGRRKGGVLRNRLEGHPRVFQRSAKALLSFPWLAIINMGPLLAIIKERPSAQLRAESFPTGMLRPFRASRRAVLTSYRKRSVEV